jgi:hypothetical protein
MDEADRVEFDYPGVDDLVTHHWVSISTKTTIALADSGVVPCTDHEHPEHLRGGTLWSSVAV